MEERTEKIARIPERQLSIEEGQKLYQNLWGGGEPDAFSMLARSIVPNTLTGEPRTGSYRAKDADLHGNIGGSHAGVVAILNLHKYFPNATAVTNSYVERTHERHAEVAAAELTAEGIARDQIEVQDKSYSTLTEILENIKLLVKNHKEHNWKHLVILVNGTQVQRVNAVLKNAATMKDPLGYREKGEGIAEALKTYLELEKAGKVKISIVSSEDVLERINTHYANLVLSAKETDMWKNTEARDNEAAEAIQDGTYGQNSPPTTIR